MCEQELVLGAVYAPAINEFYLAESCEGGETNRRKTNKIMSMVYPEVMDLRSWALLAWKQLG